MRIGCVDFVSNTFFPVIAAEELGFFRAEGLDAHVELVRPSLPALRDGSLDAVAHNATALLSSFAQWGGTKLVVAFSQGTPWLLVVRADLAANTTPTTATARSAS